MQEDNAVEEAAEPLLKIDRSVRDIFLPYRNSAPAKAISWLSQVGDQPQMRALAGGTLALGLLRQDKRMIRAGVRMLLAHEAATFAKDIVKKRVIRARPRSASNRQEQKPRAGRDTRKEQSSFPSGHSAGSMAVARAFSSEYPRHGSVALAGAAAIALARIPRCAHYPSDVAAGVVIGTSAEGALRLVWRLGARLLSARTILPDPGGTTAGKTG